MTGCTSSWPKNGSSPLRYLATSHSAVSTSWDGWAERVCACTTERGREERSESGRERQREGGRWCHVVECILKVAAIPRHACEADARTELDVGALGEELFPHAIAPLAGGDRVPGGRDSQ
eukprot:COSAG02_NODE_1055_length_14928_cov_67.022726_6_plen_120_part_00